jgi:hypothetical protein
MFKEGEGGCVERLLVPAKRVLKSGPQIRYESFERRVELWNQIRMNFDRYLEEECGTFLPDLDLHFRSQFDAALVALAASMKTNGEVFGAARMFSEDEIELYERIECYSIFEILSEKDIRKKLFQRDKETLRLLRDYYIEMDTWVDRSLERSEIRLTIRGYLKKRWDGYKRKINAAVADAVTELDWLGNLIGTWEDEARKRENAIELDLVAENEDRARKLREREEALRFQEREVARREEAAQDALKSASKREEDLNSREKRIEAAMKALHGSNRDERSRYVDTGEAKQYELTFIGRMETKIGVCPVIGGRTFRVEGSEEMEEPVVPERGGRSMQRPLPLNRSLTFRLVEKKLLGEKKHYVFSARYVCRIERYADQGYDCDPLSLTEVTAILDETWNRARSSGIPTVLCLASPTGFERRLRDFVDSEEFHRNFISKHLSFLLLDMEAGALLFNHADETARAFAAICELEIDSEKEAKVRRNVKNLMLEALKVRDHVVFDDVLKACTDDPGMVKRAFYDCAAKMEGEVQFVEGVGLVMMGL